MIGFSKSKGILAGAALAALTSSISQAAVIVNVDTPLTPVETWTIGQPTGITADVATPGAFYSNDTTFTGYVVDAPSTGTTTVTGLLADDINTTASAGFVLGQFTWSIGNVATVAQTISPYIRFYDTTGPGGGPGKLLGALNFNGISIPSYAVDGFSYNASSSAITLPASFWACEFFSAAASTAANVSLIGEGTFSPPTTGSSNDEDFTSSTAGTGTSSFLSANPAGSVNISPYAGTPVANFEWEFNGTAVPEPSAIGVIAPLALLALSRRRRLAI